MNVVELTGRAFGRLTVIKRNGSNKRGRAIWEATCECGKHINVLGNSLLVGNTLSCGCLQKDKARANMKVIHINEWSNEEFINSKKQQMKNIFTKHGARCRKNIDPLYSIWRGMKQRCKYISSYLRKNISVCSEWANSFETFKTWADENGYKKGLHIDRIDNASGYNPLNCQLIPEEEHRKKSGEETKRYFYERRIANE
jgi:hypothetical protein